MTEITKEQKPEDFKNCKTFTNVFAYMDFCRWNKLTKNNSLQVISENYCSVTLYY